MSRHPTLQVPAPSFLGFRHAEVVQETPRDAHDDGDSEKCADRAAIALLDIDRDAVAEAVRPIADLSLTVRVLEGDLNLDCIVDVMDDQIIASRCGAFIAFSPAPHQQRTHSGN